MSLLHLHQALLNGGAPAYSPLLDSYGANCVGAWSANRRLKSGITYPLKAYWNSGANSADIGFSGNTLDTAALLSAVGSGTARAELYDQSGNSRNLTHGTFGTRPRIVNAGALDTFGGKPALAYSGSQVLQFANWGTATGLSGNLTFTVFVVYQRSGNGHAFGWGLNQTSLGAVGAYNDGSSNIIAFAGGNSQPMSALSTGALNLLTVIKTPGAISSTTVARRNGSSVVTGGGSGSAPNVTAAAPLQVGGWASGSGGGPYLLSGHILEVLIYAADKSTDLTAIEADIRAFYGL